MITVGQVIISIQKSVGEGKPSPADPLTKDEFNALIKAEATDVDLSLLEMRLIATIAAFLKDGAVY